MTETLCGADAPVPVPKCQVPGKYKDCPRCIAHPELIRWGDILTVRKRRGRIAHYGRRV